MSFHVTEARLTQNVFHLCQWAEDKIRRAAEPTRHSLAAPHQRHGVGRCGTEGLSDGGLWIGDSPLEQLSHVVGMNVVEGG